MLIEDGFGARRSGRPVRALRSFRAAVVAARASEDATDLIDALKGLGQVERDLGRPESALTLYQEAVGLCRDLGDPDLLAHTVRHVGDILQDVGRLGDARPCYDEALALYRADPGVSRLDLANAVRPMAILEEAEGNVAESCRLWEKARALYAEVGVQAGVDEADVWLAQLRNR